MTTQKTIHLLLIDDHSLFRESLSRLLQAEPDFTMVADLHSSDQALATLAAHPVDLILLDYDLGTQNGLQFLDALKGTRFTGKILFITGGMSEDEMRSALPLGASGIFLK